MTTHVHDWQPSERGMAQYDCACGATGYRERGEIVANAKPRRNNPTARDKWRNANRRTKLNGQRY